MKSYEILRLACDFTQNPLREKLNSTDISSLTTAESKVADSYLNCLNLVIGEICEQYSPVTTEEILEVNNLKLTFDQFSKKPLNIFSVKNTKGRKIRYKIFDKYILVFADKAKIIYSYSPEAATLVSDIDLMIPARIIAYGVAREYFLLQGQGADADIYENRFKESLKLFISKKTAVRLPRRRWL